MLQAKAGCGWRCAAHDAHAQQVAEGRVAEEAAIVGRAADAAGARAGQHEATVGRSRNGSHASWLVSGICAATVQLAAAIAPGVDAGSVWVGDALQHDVEHSVYT